jgi:hypothetical protein
MAVLVHGVVDHVHIPLADSLALDTTEMDGLLLRVVLDDFDDGKSVDGEQMGIDAFPNGTSSRRAVVQIHTHTFSPRVLVVSMPATMLPSHMAMWRSLTSSSSPGMTIPTKLTSLL